MLSLLLFASACAFPGKGSNSGETAVAGENQAAESSAASEESDWRLILVNRWNPLPSDYQFEKEELSGGQAVDARIYPELQQMFDDARAEGVTPHISSSYRTNAEQQEIMDDKIAEYEAQGYSADEAKTAAEEWVAIPGTSEHELGLAVSPPTTGKPRTPTLSGTGSMRTAGNMALSAVIRRTRPISPASSTSRGITGMWGKKPQKKSWNRGSVWRSIWANSRKFWNRRPELLPSPPAGTYRSCLCRAWKAARGWLLRESICLHGEL